MARKGKEFTFPRNVSKSYEVFRGYTLKQLLLCLPGAVIGIVIVILPPYGFVPVFIKAWIPILAVIFTLGVIRRNPVEARPNITAWMYYPAIRKFKKAQKRFYLKPKDRRFLDEE